MGDSILTIIIAVIASGILTGLGAAIFAAWRDRRHKSDTAWDQRDRYRSRADILHEALNTHRRFCHNNHGTAYAEMPNFPGRNRE